MIMKKANFEQLKSMNYKEGKALLESLGYILAESGETESNISEWATDNYFKLYNEKDEEIDCISYEIYGNGQDGEDKEIQIVKEGWSDALRGL